MKISKVFKGLCAGSVLMGSVLLGFGTVSIAEAANPLTTKFYSADAAALVHNDSLFIFAGHDEQGPQGGSAFFLMNDWHVLVTTDMVNYHDYGAVLSWRTFSWASGNAFAGHCEYRNGKYYWYVAVHHRTIVRDEGFAIGVAVADHPSGPWKDAIGHALITDDTPNDVALNIDPAIFYDGNDIWMYWGSWNAGRRVKLKENMIELAGSPEDIKIRDFFEAPWMHKYRGNYYFSYASGYPSTINYSMAKSMNGPWTQMGTINDKMENSETNHQAIFRYLGHWYFMYHGATAPGGWTYRRSVNIDYMYYDQDAKIQKIKRTTTGVDKVNNAIVSNGTFRLTVSHSNLVLQDNKGVVTQETLNENNRSQYWKLTHNEKNRRHYSLQNVGTGNYYCPTATLLDTVKTSKTPCEIRIENASEAKGYYLYGDYESDFVGDVLNVSKDVGMPVITWVRTGADNQKIKMVKTLAPELSSSSVAPAISSSSEAAVASSNSVPPPISSDEDKPSSSGSEDEIVSSSSENIEGTESDETGLASVRSAKPGYSVVRNGNDYTIRFDKVGNYNLYVLNSMGQVVVRKNVDLRSEVQIENLPKANYVFRVIAR